MMLVLTTLLGGLPALISFLGGATARAVIGHFIKFFEQKQSHEQEMQKLQQQATFDAARSDQNAMLIRLQSDLKINEIKLVGEAAIGLEEAKAFTAAMADANKPTGVSWVDGWNGCIRPGAATISIVIWLLKIIKAGLTVTAWDENLVASILGYYFADRQLGKRNK